MESSLLSRAECNALRGLAILGIFLHNYCHWLAPSVKENEYQFFVHNVDRMWYAVSNPDLNLPIHLLSFFGHYGVPVFLFLSAYGLFMKYETSTTTDFGRLPFIREHFLKLFNMMFVGFVAFTMVDAVTPGPHHYAVVDIIAQMGMFNNVLPNPDKIIWPGPYWFFGLMLQLYIVYRLLLYRRHWSLSVVLVILCWLAQAFCSPEGETLNRIRYNFIGGMLPFALGLLYARFGKHLDRIAYGTVAAVSLCLIWLLSLSYQTWYWVPVFVISFSIGIVKLLPSSINKAFEWIGGISAALFVCHPITRKIFIPVSRHGDIYTGLLLYVISSMALALLFREIIKRFPSPKMK